MQGKKCGPGCMTGVPARLPLLSPSKLALLLLVPPQASMPVHSLAACKRYYKAFDARWDAQFCAGRREQRAVSGCRAAERRC